MERITIISLVLAGAAVACGGTYSEPAPVTAQTYAPAPAMTPASAPAVPREPPPAAEIESKLQSDLPTRSQIEISDQIQQACGISDGDGYFPFDASQITAQDERVAKQLVDCFTAGAMSGKHLRLIGHADPRGSEGYNLVLGQRRAQNFKLFLVQAGIPGDRILTASRGKSDAKGYDETTWALDRVVEIEASD